MYISIDKLSTDSTTTFNEDTFTHLSLQPDGSILSNAKQDNLLNAFIEEYKSSVNAVCAGGINLNGVNGSATINNTSIGSSTIGWDEAPTYKALYNGWPYNGWPYNGGVATNFSLYKSFYPENKVAADGSLEMYIDIPGVKPENLTVTLKDYVVTVKATREGRTQTSMLDTNFVIHKFYDADSISAELIDGVLILKFKKVPEESPRKISVKHK